MPKRSSHKEILEKLLERFEREAKWWKKAAEKEQGERRIRYLAYFEVLDSEARYYCAELRELEEAK